MEVQMQLKKFSGQDGRNQLSMEAKVRAIKLWNVDGMLPTDILDDLERVFGIKIAESNHKQPKRFLQQIERNLIKLLDQELEENVHRSRLYKLLSQSGLVGIVEFKDSGEQE
jgi:hypothetical protein